MTARELWTVAQAIQDAFIVDEELEERSGDGGLSSTKGLLRMRGNIPVQRRDGAMISCMFVFASLFAFIILTSCILSEWIFHSESWNTAYVLALGGPLCGADQIPTEYQIRWRCRECAPGCLVSWIGDGVCDDACRYSACGYDGSDCIEGDTSMTAPYPGVFNKSLSSPADISNQFSVSFFGVEGRDSCGCEAFNTYLYKTDDGVITQLSDNATLFHVSPEHAQSLGAKSWRTFNNTTKESIGIILIGLVSFYTGFIIYTIAVAYMSIGSFVRSRDSFIGRSDSLKQVTVVNSDGESALGDSLTLRDLSGSVVGQDAKGQQDESFEQPMVFDAIVVRVAPFRSEDGDLPQVLTESLRRRGLSVFCRNRLLDAESIHQQESGKSTCNANFSELEDGVEFAEALQLSRVAILCVSSESFDLLEDRFSPLALRVEAALRVAQTTIAVKMDASMGYPSTWPGRLGAIVSDNTLVYKCHDVESIEGNADAIVDDIMGSATEGTMRSGAPSSPVALQLESAWGNDVEPDERIAHDVFLSHAWGENRSTHLRVVEINAALQAAGVVTWFDEDKMKGNINEAMREGIDTSSVVVVFVTFSYQEKLVRNSDFDNCRREYQASLRIKGTQNMLFVIMDEDMLDTSAWTAGLEAANSEGTHPCITQPALGDDSGCVGAIAEFVRKFSSRAVLRPASAPQERESQAPSIPPAQETVSVADFQGSLKKGADSDTSGADSDSSGADVESDAVDEAPYNSSSPEVESTLDPVLARELNEILASNNTPWIPTGYSVTWGGNMGEEIHRDMAERAAQSMHGSSHQSDEGEPSDGEPFNMVRTNRYGTSLIRRPRRGLRADGEDDFLTLEEHMARGYTSRHDDSARWRLCGAFFFPVLILVVVMLATIDAESFRSVAVDPPDSFACTVPDEWRSAMDASGKCPVVVLQDVARWRWVRDFLSSQASDGALPMEALPMAESANDAGAIVLTILVTIFLAFPLLSHVACLLDYYFAATLRLGFDTIVSVLGFGALDARGEVHD